MDELRKKIENILNAPEVVMDGDKLDLAATQDKDIDQIMPLIASYSRGAETLARIDERDNMKFIESDGTETYKPFVQYRYTGGGLLVDWDYREKQLKEALRETKQNLSEDNCQICGDGGHTEFDCPQPEGKPNE